MLRNENKWREKKEQEKKPQNSFFKFISFDIE